MQSNFLQADNLNTYGSKQGRWKWQEHIQGLTTVLLWARGPAEPQNYNNTRFKRIYKSEYTFWRIMISKWIQKPQKRKLNQKIKPSIDVLHFLSELGNKFWPFLFEMGEVGFTGHQTFAPFPSTGGVLYTSLEELDVLVEQIRKFLIILEYFQLNWMNYELFRSSVKPLICY